MSHSRLAARHEQAMNPAEVAAVVRRALREDLADVGDITTDAVLDTGTQVDARIVAWGEGTVAGVGVAEAVFHTLDPTVQYTEVVSDGHQVEAGTVIAGLRGPGRAILTGERTALNFLSHLSGIATATADLVHRVEGTRARIVDTRKTTPGLRALEKYAVRMGGGANHRFGLHDAVLVKDNHIAAAGGIGAAVERVRSRVGHMVKIEVEVDTLDQLKELVPMGVDAVLLDNMDPDTLRQAVRRVDGQLVTEASGNITAATVRQVAETGVDYISVGWVTHSSSSLDVSLAVGPGSAAG